MIEVEIRGKLTKEEYLGLKNFLSQHGEFKERHNREMFLLTEYPGYAHSSVNRDVDIRLRDTDGNCEIMVKFKKGEGNTAREEISLKLVDTNLEQAKKVVKALGCTKAVRMHRVKELYRYNNIEWSLVTTPGDDCIYYYEAEQEVASQEEIAAAHSYLAAEAKKLNLEVLNPAQMQQFIDMLNIRVNKEIIL